MSQHYHPLSQLSGCSGLRGWDPGVLALPQLTSQGVELKPEMREDILEKQDYERKQGKLVS